MPASKIWDVQENGRDDWSRWSMRAAQSKVERTRWRHRVWSLMLASAAVNDAALTDEHTQSKTIIMDSMWNRLQQHRLFPISSSWSCLFWIILISLLSSQKKKEEDVTNETVQNHKHQREALWWSASSKCTYHLLALSPTCAFVSWTGSRSWSCSCCHSVSRALLHIILGPHGWSVNF